VDGRFSPSRAIHFPTAGNRSPLDSELRSPYSDEYSISVDRDLGGVLTVSMAYVRKDGTDYIGWAEVGGQYRQDTRTLPDGSTLPVQVLTSATSTRRFALTNPEGYSLTYNGLVTTFERRAIQGWRALGSYTYSRASGLQVSSGPAAAGEQLSTLTSSGVFGRDPNDLHNARGRLANDRPHMFRTMGSVDVPRTGLVVAGNLRYFSGKPWAASTQVSLPQGNRRVLLEPPGSRRLSSQSLVDLRVSKTFRFGNMQRLELMMDLLNVFNDTAEEALVTDNRFSPTFGQPNVFMSPRRVMLGARLDVGR